MSSIANVSHSSGSSAIYGVDPVAADGLSTLSPENFLEWVSGQLDNVDAQLNDYKLLLSEKRSRAKELMEAQSIIRTMKAAGGGQIGAHSAEDYNRLMTLLSKHADDPSVRKTYELFQTSYGGYVSTADVPAANTGGVKAGEVVGVMAGDHLSDEEDMLLNGEEAQSALDNLRDALAGLNSENDMDMLALKSLVDQRSLIVTKASQWQASDHDTKKTILSNWR